MRRALFSVLALLAILVLSAPPPAIATDTIKAGSEPIPILTVAITGDSEGTTFAITFWGTVFRDETQSAATATWTSFQRGDGLTIAAIPSLATAPTATVRDLATTHGAITGSPWRLADCTGTGTAHDGTGADTRKPTALIASTGGILGQPLRR